MNFYNYMIRNYKTSDSPAGDLARDMARDSEHFPRNRACKFKGWHDIIHNHLVRSGACDACLERLLRRLGFPVYVLDDTEQIGGILDEIRTS